MIEFLKEHGDIYEYPILGWDNPLQYENGNLELLEILLKNKL